MIETTAQEIYLSCAFVINSDLKRYGRLIEEVENDYTKVNDNYPCNIVKAYQLLNEYKQWNQERHYLSHQESHFRNRVIIINMNSKQQNGRKKQLATIVDKKDTSGPNVQRR